MYKSKRGEMGVGTIVVFIAMILVAAIAAAVFLVTTMSLQDKALLTGSDASDQISTSLSFVEISGRDGSDGTIENFTMLTRIASGSESIDLSTAALSISLSNASVTLSYQNNSDLLVPSNASKYFSIEYLVRGSEFVDGSVSRGDMVRFFAYPPRNITSDEEFRVSFTPKVGHQLIKNLRAPLTINRNTVVLFP